MKTEAKYIQPINVENLFHSSIEKEIQKMKKKAEKRDVKFENRTFVINFHSV